MGFLDKVKEVGNQAASSVNQAVSKGQQQFDEQKSRKQSDALLRDLGALVYRRDSGRGDTTTDASITRITAELQALEAAGSPVDLSERAGAVPAQAEGAAPPAPGAAAAPSGDVAPPPPPGAVAPPPPPGTVGQ